MRQKCSLSLHLLKSPFSFRSKAFFLSQLLLTYGKPINSAHLFCNFEDFLNSVNSFSVYLRLSRCTIILPTNNENLHPDSFLFLPWCTG